METIFSAQRSFCRKPMHRKAAVALLAAGASFFLATAGHADALSFTSMPASNAAAEMSRRFGVSIVFRGTVAGSKPVTFTVDDADTPGGRLQAVNSLANALNLDFQKVFVVSKVDPGTSAPEVKIDNDGPVVFPSTKVSAREAIQTIAGVDGALTQISSAITGTVTLPQRRMTAATAAALIAKQTHTVWRAYYGLFPRGQEPQRLKGDVIGQDANGQAITSLPVVSFRTPTFHPVAVSGVPNDGASGLPVTGLPDVTTIPSGGGFGSPDYSYNPYAYGSPYGYDPYGGNPGYGYAAPNGGIAYPGSVYTPGGGVEPAVPGYNAPGYFPPGVGVTSVPSSGNTILPDFPYGGGYGGY